MRLLRFLVHVGLLAVAGQAGAADRHVPSQYATIQAAMNACVDGDVVIVANGIYTGAGNKNLHNDSKAITVRSASDDPELCVIDCEQDGRGFSIDSGCQIQGFTVRNGRLQDEGSGGGIYLSGSAAALHCIIANNEALGSWGVYYSGGGVFLAAPQAVLHNCTISDNTADYGGGVAGYDGQGVVESCAVRNNIAHYGGGGVCNVGLLHNSEVTGNGTTYYGGGVLCSPHPIHAGMDIRSCTIADNAGGYYGGGLYTLGFRFLGLANTIFAGNSARYGNQMALEDGAVARFYYCDVAGDGALFVSSGAVIEYGDGMLTDDPRFVDPGCGDYRLEMDSPCVDAGWNAVIPYVALDPDGVWDDPVPWDCAGSMRVARFTTDMGAYEIPYADLNCDKAVNAFDIDPFVLALTDAAGYGAAFPDCDQFLADTNGDGAVNAFDIDPFVQLLTSGL